MAEKMSPNLQLNDLSAEEITLSKLQGKPEVPLSLPESGTDEEYPFLTPEPKLASQKRHNFPSYTSDIFLSSGSGSSDNSTKEGSETLSSSSSSDAESGTDDQRTNNDKDLQPKVIDFEFDTTVLEENRHIANEVDGEGMVEGKKDVCYEELLNKVSNYEDELKFTKNKLQTSQEEIARLKYENLTLVEELGNTIEKLRTSENNMKTMEHDLRNEFAQHQHQFQHQLDLANQSIDLLQAELGSERRLISELQEMISKTTNDLNDYGREVEELKLALHDAQKDFSKERSQFQYEITCLIEEKDALELRNKLLEEQINQYEIEKIEAGKLHEAKETGLLDEINQLNAELSQRSHLVETLNKNLDANSLKYDTLMAEKDEVFAKVQTLVAELNTRNTNMLQMENQISKLSTEHMEMLDEFEKTKQLVEELRLKVTDREKEVEKQRGVIYDSANEKREAIRQLCFSLEYYRNEYHELRQVFIKYKQPAVLAA